MAVKHLERKSTAPPALSFPETRTCHGCGIVVKVSEKWKRNDNESIERQGKM